MALQRPGAVPRLALINSLASYRIDDFRKWFEARVPAALVRTIGMRNMARLLSGRSFPEAWQRPMRERAIEVIGKVPAGTFLGMCAGLERWRALDRLGSLRSRTLLIAGEHDFTSLEEKAALAARIGAQFVAVRGSRHGTPFDSVAITNACLLALLTDQPLPPRELWTRDESAEASAAALAIRIAEEHAAARELPGFR
jgi:pimeloyl-ACP methyl ester carboxylesterase